MAAGLINEPIPRSFPMAAGDWPSAHAPCPPAAHPRDLALCGIPWNCMDLRAFFLSRRLARRPLPLPVLLPPAPAARRLPPPAAECSSRLATRPSHKKLRAVAPGCIFSGRTRVAQAEFDTAGHDREQTSRTAFLGWTTSRFSRAGGSLYGRSRRFAPVE